jgi:serine/threonine protein phosphatase PrpC
VRLAAGSLSHTGLVRGNNEDAFLVDKDHVLFAVADGVGGHRGGEVASRTAIEALRAAVAAGRSVQDAITSANEAVIERARGDTDLTGMGTTMTAMVVGGGRQVLIGHVGDSRAYLLHDGSLRRVTDDHSLVEELVRDGRLTPEQAESHPQRNIVTRALGLDEPVEVDLYRLDVSNGDRIILCSDGLTTMVRERDIERIARSEPDPQRTAEELVDAANNAGGEDNTSVVVVDVLEVDAADAPATEPVTPPPSPARIMPPAPDVPEPSTQDSWPKRVRNALLLFVPLILVLAIAVGGVGWYARRSYYVGFAGNRVVIYKGIPGGVLGWNPTVDERTKLSAAQLTPIDRERVAGGAARGSVGEARRFVARLQAGVDATSTTTTTTTTRPRATTTTRPRPRKPTATTRPAAAHR